MENFLSIQSKFQKAAVKYDNFLNFITSQVKHTDKIYKKPVVSKIMLKETQRRLKPVGTKRGIMCASCRAHKKSVDGFPRFRPFLFA